MQNANKVIMVLASMSLAACGSGEDTAQINEPSTPEIAVTVSADMDLVDWRQPCKLAHADDFAAVFPDVNFDTQDHLDDGLDRDGAATGRCVYNARAFRAEDAYEVIVTLAGWQEEKAAYTEFARLTASVEEEGVETLDGFAEGAAYLVHYGEPVTAFMHEGTLIEIGVKHDARATFDGHDPSIALARRIAKRL